MDLGLDIVDGVRRLNFESDSFAREADINEKSGEATEIKSELYARLYEDLHFTGSFGLSNEQAVESSTKARAAVVVVVVTCNGQDD